MDDPDHGPHDDDEDVVLVEARPIVAPLGARGDVRWSWNARAGRQVRRLSEVLSGAALRPDGDGVNVIVVPNPLRRLDGAPQPGPHHRDGSS